MRTTRILAAALVVMSLAACTTGASPVPSTTPVSHPTTEGASPMPSPSPTAEVLRVSGAFDGQSCTYTGPTVIPAGTLTQFAYDAGDVTELSVLVVIPVASGTTWDQITSAASERPASDIPGFVLVESFINVEPGDSALLTIRSRNGAQAYGGYLVGCATAPASDGGSDRMYPASLIEVGGA